MNRPAFEVRVHTAIEEVGPEWDGLMAAAGAPVFYRRPFLRAFERHPLHPVERTAYLLVLDDTGTPAAGLPAYLQRGVDPMRVIADHFPANVGRTALLSHVWHCFDTVLPQRPGSDDAPTRAALDALRRLAAEWGAQLWGLANVDAATPLAALLTARGMHAVDIDVGWGLDTSTTGGYPGYLTGLRSMPRRNLARALRAADRAGLAVTTTATAGADLDGFVRLARATAAKFGNSDYYRPGLFQDFVRALGEDVHAIELRIGDRLVGSALVLTDDTRYHWWVCGFVPLEEFSPFYVAFAHVMQGGFASGRPWIELGRRNPDFKRRYGLTPRSLRAWLDETG
ncbi:GNAT family N-acetyltransferase [Kitasatospora sp. NPDC001664]